MRAVVERSTVVRHAVGRDVGNGVRVGLALLEGGGTALVRLVGAEGPAGLAEVDGAPVARGDDNVPRG
jgi:hypothetical protein